MHTRAHLIVERFTVTITPQRREVVVERHEQHIAIDVTHRARPDRAAIPLGPVGSTEQVAS